jgi:hypothetical protein
LGDNERHGLPGEVGLVDSARLEASLLIEPDDMASPSP